jgi:S-formylglutathione hydrolase FrmB
MLHGSSGSAEEWVAWGLVDRADELIIRKEILPLIIVMPQGDLSYWVNLPDGSLYGDYLVKDLRRHLAATYRVLPGAEHRAIGGLSMGGSGALANGFLHPDVFGVVGAHSAALLEEGERPFLGTGQDFERQTPLWLTQTADALDSLTIWIDVGDQDMWADRNVRLHDALSQRGVDHDWDLSVGGEHAPWYWSSRLVDYLRFYDVALHPERRL